MGQEGQRQGEARDKKVVDRDREISGTRKQGEPGIGGNQQKIHGGQLEVIKHSFFIKKNDPVGRGGE